MLNLCKLYRGHGPFASWDLPSVKLEMVAHDEVCSSAAELEITELNEWRHSKIVVSSCGLCN